MAGVKKANRRTLKTDIKDVDWARLAAYIDGEGCIDIHTNKGQEALGKSRTHSLVLFVANTDPRLLNWIVDTFGVGKCYRLADCPSIVAHVKSGKWRTRFQWWVVSSLAAQILEGCLPFFIIKREQAEIAIAFQKTKIHHNQGGKRGIRLHPNVIQMREQMAHEVRGLKHVNHELKEIVNG